MSSSIVVRNIDEATHARLKHEAAARKMSVNALMQQFILNGLKSRDGQPHEGPYRDLDSLAGRWTTEDEAEFFAGIAPMTEIDGELWR